MPGCVCTDTDPLAIGAATDQTIDSEGTWWSLGRIAQVDPIGGRAGGELANLIYRYLTECEKFCAQEQKVNYVGPSFSRYSPEGEKLAQKAALQPGKHSR